jgi:hypothetical protein
VRWANIGAKERNETEWRGLLASVGLEIIGIHGRDLWQAVIEAVKF